MGYLTQSLISESTVFRQKVKLALVKKVDAILQGTNQSQIDMSKEVIQSADRFVAEIADLLVLDGLDLDSTDAAIDAGLLGTIDWLTARTT